MIFMEWEHIEIQLIAKCKEIDDSFYEIREQLLAEWLGLDDVCEHKKHKLFLCKCGNCYTYRDNYKKHLRQTKRWRKYHYAPTYSEVPFIIWLQDGEVI